VACGPPAFGGPDESVKTREHKWFMFALATCIRASWLIRAARSAAPQATHVTLN
jgi:hypothetical protein